MKRVFTLLLVPVMLAACSGNKKSPSDDATKHKAALGQMQALVQKLKPIIQGGWVNKAYIDKILKTKSPQAASDASGIITAMWINFKGDSLEIGANYNNHEGNVIKGKLKPGRRPFVLGFYNDNGTDDELGYTFKNGDTVLLLYTHDAGTKRVIKTEYVKSLIRSDNFSDKTDYLDEVDYLINRGLIAGKYVNTDTLGAKSDVVFTNGGNVKGLSNFKTYYIQDDFTGPEENLDQIIFELYKKNQVDFAFKIKADTLSIFTTKESADSTELYYNKLVYKLVKSK
jgi:hypothetical protein